MTTLEVPPAVREAGRIGPRRGRYAPRWLRKAGNGLLNGWAVLAYVYLFAPIIVIVVFSFNNLNGITHPFNYTWRGFTFSNWAHPFGKFPELGRAMVESLKIAFIAPLVATVMGSLVAIALSRYRFPRWLHRHPAPRAATHHTRDSVSGRRCSRCSSLVDSRWGSSPSSSRTSCSA